MNNLRPPSHTPGRATRWRDALAVYLEARVLILFAMGFSSGLPLLLVFGTLSFWLREADVSLTDIGYMSWVALAYGFKWLWSPLVDRLPLPLLSRLLGRRRSWMLFSQVLIALSLVGMAYCDPKTQLAQLALFALLVAFSSATQDIVIDAYRIESAPERLQAAMAASYMTGYRLAMIMAGAGALALAAWLGSNSGYDYRGWQLTYLLMGGLMSLGILTTLMSHEPQIDLKSQDEQQMARKATLLARGWSPTLAGLAIDGNPTTVWPIDTYTDPVPFPNFKNGVGLMLQLPEPATIGSVTINLNSTGTSVQIRSADTATPSSLEDTTALTDPTPLKPGSNTIEVPDAQPTSNVLVWVSTLGQVSGESRSDIAEITLNARS